jgi:cyclopropane fatty-acyl-phospholipid synthase-like methyltransferase
MGLSIVNKSNVLEVNKKCWDTVSHHFHGVEALPEYGPFTQTEEELKLFDKIANKKVLEIGCGSGHSLKYMASQHAGELWGLDLSESQIVAARETLAGHDVKLLCSSMETECNIPKDYFDIVFSIYALGWSADLLQTLSLIYSYLKKGEALFLVGNIHFIQAWKERTGGIH